MDIYLDMCLCWAYVRTAPKSPNIQGRTCVLLDHMGCVTTGRAHPQVTATAPEVSSSDGAMAAK